MLAVGVATTLAPEVVSRVAPGVHVYETAPEAVKVALPPVQTVTAGETLNVAGVKTVVVTAALGLSQPPGLTTDT